MAVHGNGKDTANPVITITSCTTYTSNQARLTFHIYTPHVYIIHMVLHHASVPHIQDGNVGETQWRNQCSSEPGENCSRFGPINSSAWFIIRFLCRAEACLKVIWTNILPLSLKTIISFITYSSLLQGVTSLQCVCVYVCMRGWLHNLVSMCMRCVHSSRRSSDAPHAHPSLLLKHKQYSVYFH